MWGGIDKRFLLLAALLSACQAAVAASAVPPGPLGPAQLKQTLANILNRRLEFVDLSYTAPGNQDAKGGWLARYNWTKSRRNGKGFTVEKGVARVRNSVFNFALDGSYAYGNTTNTDNYSHATLDFSLERGSFGPVGNARPKDTVGLEKCLQAVDITDAVGIKACHAKFDARRFVPDPANTRFLSAGIHFAYEGNQNFSARNKDYGASIYYSYSTWPTVGIVLDRVDPAGNEARIALAGTDPYNRVAVKLAWQVNLGDLAGFPMWLYISGQHYEELAPPAAIRAAGMNRFDFVSTSLRFPAGAVSSIFSSDQTMLFIRYTSGKLPFDVRKNTAVELGISTNIATLANLLATQ